MDIAIDIAKGIFFILIIVLLNVLFWVGKIFLKSKKRIVRKATVEDLDSMYNLIQKVDLDRDIFLKASKPSIAERLEYSYVCVEDNKIIGVCLIDHKKYDTDNEVWVIDTMVSSKRGVGSQLLSNIPDREYYTSISERNNKSMNLFKKFGFVQIGYNKLYGYERIRFKKS